jgi:hypothetical protein
MEPSEPSSKHSELFNWVDSLGNDQEDLSGCELFSRIEKRNFTQIIPATKQKISLEDRLIEEYVSGNLKNRCSTIRVVFILLGSRIYDCLRDTDIFKLMEVDDFIGGRAMSYKLFSPKRTDQLDLSQIKSTNTSFLTNVNSVVSETNSNYQQTNILPKTEQAMVRIRRTNLVLNRPESRKGSTLSGGENFGVLNLVSTSQLSRPDTAESITSSRIKLAPISSMVAKQSLVSKGHPSKEPNLNAGHGTISKLFSIPFSAEQQLHKNPQLYEMHYIRFGECLIRQLQVNFLECIAKKCNILAAVEQSKKLIATIQNEAIEFRGKGSRGPHENRFWELVKCAAQLSTEMANISIGKELCQLEEQLLIISSCKDLIQSSDRLLQLCSTSLSSSTFTGNLIQAIIACKVSSILLENCHQNCLLSTPSLLSNPSASGRLSMQLAQIFSGSGKIMLSWASACSSSSMGSVVTTIAQAINKQVADARRMFTYCKTIARVLRGKDGGTRLRQALIGIDCVVLYREDAQLQWETVRERLADGLEEGVYGPHEVDIETKKASGHNANRQVGEIRARGAKETGRK